MDFLTQFYNSRLDCQRRLVSSVQAHVQKRRLNASDVDAVCGFANGTWEAIVSDPSRLTSDEFIDVCFALELDIEDAMPLELDAEQLDDVVSVMNQNKHGLVAYAGWPCEPNEPAHNGIQEDSCEELATSAPIGYEQQAQLYIRLRTLDSLAELESQAG